MQADFKVVIDACVLANIAVCDVFLRLAEKPRLYLPRWPTEILDETRRVQSEKLNWPERLVASWRDEVVHSFPDAAVDDYEHLIERVTNHEKDRHVLAAVIHSRSQRPPDQPSRTGRASKRIGWRRAADGQSASAFDKL